MTYTVYFSIRNFISRIEKLCGSAARLYFTMENVKLEHEKTLHLSCVQARGQAARAIKAHD
jgi:hypothetical protein